MYIELPELAERGYVLLDQCDLDVPADEYESLEYRDWKSGGDTNFAPIASAYGAIECAGFWDHGKPDKGGVWTSNAERCPTLVRWATRSGANFGRVRTIKLEPNVLPDVERWLHLDDNNRLNPEGTGWVVRAWLQLSDHPDSCMILRPRKHTPEHEVRLPLPRGAQFVVDSERWYHGVYHPGPGPRYALIVSLESGPELAAWIEANRRRVPAGV
jgi:hypothetical protein